MHIHGIVDGDEVSASFCPTAADDSNGDGVLTVLEGVPKYGGVQVSLAAEADPPTSTVGTTESQPRPGSGDVDYPTGIVPTRLQIPAIGVDADTVELDIRGVEPEVPVDFADTGWYQQTRLPGEIGPAVIAGHIDSVNGPAVFVNLDRLETGDEIIVSNQDGETRSFVVTHSAQYPKADLPVEVFGFDKPLPELRLITCGGVFDRDSGHYRDNYVVYADLREGAGEP